MGLSVTLKEDWLNREWQLFLHPSPFFGTRLKELAQYRTPIQENRFL
jgi:hypothetical protein